MPGLSLTVRYVVTLVGTVLFAVVAAVGLWAHDHADRRARALAGHAGLVLQDLGDAVEARLALGLPLAQLPEMDRLLDAARQQIPAAHGLSVVDDSGRAVFSTDPVEVGEMVLAVPPQGQTLHDGHRIGGEEEVFWHPLTNDFGVLAGAVLLRLPQGSVSGETVSFALSLVIRLAPLLAGLLAAAVGLGLLIGRAAQGRVAATAAALSGLSVAPAGDAAGGLEEPLAAFADRVRQCQQVLDAGESELGRLDELA